MWFQTDTTIHAATIQDFHHMFNALLDLCVLQNSYC